MSHGMGFYHLKCMIKELSGVIAIGIVSILFALAALGFVSLVQIL
tara:strand:- start:375 stop:509 length:135 start_codon:yes stop_codon:yes gene_type:complete